MATFPDVAVHDLLGNLKGLAETNPELTGRKDFNAVCEELKELSDFLSALYSEQEYEDDEDDSARAVETLRVRCRKHVSRAEVAIETYITTVSEQKARAVTTVDIDHGTELWSIHMNLKILRHEIEGSGKEEMILRMKKPIKQHRGQIVRRRDAATDNTMVTFNDAVEDILVKLREGGDELKVVSICGMRGLGKSTLAKKVLKYRTVEHQFAVRVFVNVSQEFKRKEVLLKLVRSFGDIISADDANKMDESELQEFVRDHLDKVNYLIVLDDVWTQEAWDCLKTCFPNNVNHSRILLTTRNMGVAYHAGATGVGRTEPFMLRFLNPEESKELLRKKIFGTNKDINKPELEKYERIILNSCRGFPLTIALVAGILSVNPEDSLWWEAVGSELESFGLDNIRVLMKMSFDLLPYRLKPCFLYFGVFPEDSEIDANTLYQLWVSEGYIQPTSDGKETLEDIAESYLELLVDRNLVTVENRRLNGRIKTISIHDIVQHFCKIKSAEDGFSHEIKYGDDFIISSDNDHRRLCINYNVQKYITSTNIRRVGRHVRSFLSFSSEEESGLPKEEYVSETETLMETFKLLKVFDARSIRFTRFPVQLFYNILLKYIAMSTHLKIIPEELSNLRYLQTLIFHTTETNIDMQADISKMLQLRHLQTNKSTRLSKTNEDLSMSISGNLQTLASISPESCTPELFRRMAQKLKKICVSGELDPYMEILFDSLQQLQFLENLKLWNANTNVPLKFLSSDSSFPRRLTQLTLKNTMLDWKWISTLVKLRNLEVLKLKENAFMGKYWDTETTGSFMALKVLLIADTDLVIWRASKGSFPQLTQLYLKHCCELENFPYDLVDITTLKLIDIFCCNPQLGKSAQMLHSAKLQMMRHSENYDTNTPLKLSVHPPQ